MPLDHSHIGRHLISLPDVIWSPSVTSKRTLATSAKCLQASAEKIPGSEKIPRWENTQVDQ